MTIRLLTATALTLAVTLAAAPADARGLAKAESACEDAIRGELGDGHTRLNRVRSVDADGVTRIWMTVRHKSDTEAKSSRYRALCVVEGDNSASVDIESGWWRKARRGQAPQATD